MNTASGLWSREALAGYDRDRISSAVVTVVGLGAGGSNAVQTLALSGVGELRLIDFDVVEPSNLARSPLFDRRRLAGNRKRYKAREAALGAAATSFAENPRVLFAVARLEAVGMAALAGSHAVVAAVDSLPVRALLADQTRLLGIPLVELGFSGFRGQVSVFPNREGGEPCWRCLHPTVEEGTASCTLYAQQVAAGGAVPATQPLAAVFGAWAAEQAIQAIHGRFPLGRRAAFFDLHSGKTNVVGLSVDPACPGVHRRLGTIQPLDAGCEEPLASVLKAASPSVKEPLAHLPAPFVVAMPCADCGASVSVGKPVWQILSPPRCRECPAVPQLGSAGTVIATTVASDDPLAERRCRALGLGRGAILEIEDRATGSLTAVKLAGDAEDLFERVGRAGNGKAGSDRES
jgi:molybdopterin/thiamine biosynthesis adenylyltransferase